MLQLVKTSRATLNFTNSYVVTKIFVIYAKPDLNTILVGHDSKLVLLSLQRKTSIAINAIRSYGTILHICDICIITH